VRDGAARRLAQALDRRGLAAPGRLLADAHRPLAPLLNDLGAAIGPLLSTAVDSRAADLRSILDDPRGLDRVIEELDHRPSQGPRADAG
jgi:hypothetical protein